MRPLHGLLGHGRLRVAAWCTLAAAGVAVVAGGGSGYPLRAITSVSGAAWLLSSGQGQVALIDGPTAEVVVQIAVAVPGHDLASAQSGGNALVIDRTNGTIERVDANTWQVSDPAAAIEGASTGLDIVASPNAVFAVDGEQGLIVELSRDTLQPRGPGRSLSGGLGPAAPVIDDQGDLWLLDTRRGDLLHMRSALTIAARAAADPESGRLVVAAGRPVVINPESGSAVEFDGGGNAIHTACADVDPDDSTARFVGSTTRPEVYAVSGATGVLRVTNLATGSCDGVVASLADAGSDLGQPVELARRVFVPNRTTGQVIVVDLDARQVLVTTDPVVGPGASLELTPKDGFVFYNDPSSEKAGVLDLDGTVHAVSKYDTSEPGKDVAPAEPPRDAPSATAPPTAEPQETTPTPSTPPRRSVPGATRPPAATRPPPAPPPASTAELHIMLAGTGTGTVQVTSSAGTSTCTATCSLPLAVGTDVTLQAAGTAGSTFAGWGNVGCVASSCALTIGAGATTADPPGVNSVTATFAAAPPPDPTLTVAPMTVDPDPRATGLTLTLTGGSGGETWTAQAGALWLVVTPNGTFTQDGTSAVAVSYAAGRQAYAPNDTTPGAISVSLYAADGRLLQTIPVAVRSDGAPTLSNAHCEASSVAGSWQISVTASDYIQSAIAVRAILTDTLTSAVRTVYLQREATDTVWTSTETMDNPTTVVITAYDGYFETPVPATLNCG